MSLFHSRSVRTVVASGLAVLNLLIAAPPARADEVRDAQWQLRYLRVAQAHQITKGGGVTVAVIDSGVDSGHPDLKKNVIAGADFAYVSGGGGDDGRTDLDGHGTAMAGLIAAHGRGSSGVLGIAPEARILPIRDRGWRNDLVRGTSRMINWAVQNGANVISMSFAGDRESDTSEALRVAREADVVLVAAVGNSPDDSSVRFPAAYPGVVAVAGVDRRGNHAAVSVTGPEVVIAAPAVDIMATDIRTGDRTGYAIGTGTSNATAIVAGAAALVRAKFPELSAEEVVHRLTATATDKGPKGRDSQYGYGVLNLVAALTEDVPPMPSATATPPGPGPGAAPPPRPERRLPMGPLLLLAVGGALLVGATAGLMIWLGRSRRSAQ